MPLLIRSVRKDDQQVWRGLWEQYNQFYKRTIPANVTDTTFARFLDEDVRMYCAVAEDNDSSSTKDTGSSNDSSREKGEQEGGKGGKIIGFIHWYPHLSTSSIAEVVYIHDLFVDPSVRNKGTGRHLIEHVYEHAKTKMDPPAASVYWHTQYFNYAGQLLYTKVADRTDFVVYRKVL